MQRPLALRHSQFVARLREVIHPYIEVAGLQKFLQPDAENLKLLHPFRQIHRKRALLLLQPRHMRIAEQRHAIRRKLHQLIDRLRKTSPAI